MVRLLCLPDKARLSTTDTSVAHAAKLIGQPQACKEGLFEMRQSPASGPQLPIVVHRKRLHQRLDGVQSPGIVIVIAQAAQGKTTLIADYLEASGTRFGWMALGPEDADPAHFVRHLVRVLKPYAKPARPPSGPQPSVATSAMIARVCRQLPPDLKLVFDGWHRIGSTPQALAWINAIIAARPAAGGLFLISREDLPVELQQDRMRRQALWMTDEDLAFTEEEIGHFFHTVNGIALSAARRQHIHRLTAGWAGGLMILAEELHRHPGHAEAILSAPTLLERLQTETGAFFKETAYRRQPKEMQAFLSLSALLDSVPADLLRAELGRNQADQMFAEAARQHLFLQVLQRSPNQWSIRLNPLYRAFLRTCAREWLSAEEIKAFLVKAAHFSQARGALESAANYYLQTNQSAAAARTITTIGLELLINGRFDELRRWTNRLPPADIAADPWLSLLRATAFRIKGGRRTIAELQSAHQAFCQAKHVRGQMLALAYLIETGVFVGYAPEALAPWIAEGEKLLRETRRLPHFTYAKALLWQQIGLGVLARCGDNLQKGLSACENTIVLGKRTRNQTLVINALSIAAHAYVQAGEFDQGRACLKAADKLAPNDRFPEYGALSALAAFHLALMAARLTAAADGLQKIRDAIDTFGLLGLYPAYLEAYGILQIHQKQHAALEKTQRHLHDVAILLNNPRYRAIGFWLAGLSGYHQEDYRRARTAVHQVLTITGLPATLRARNQSLLGFIALNSGQFTEAARHFAKALAVFEKKGLALYACEAHLGMALLHNACQDTASAKISLDTAFQTAAAQRYSLLPHIRPTDLARACVLSIQLDIPSAVEHARHLLADRLSDAEIRNLASPRTAGTFARSIDANATRRAIYRARIPVLVIRTLGGLQILRNGTDPLNPPNWQGSRPALLLKAILVHGGRHIPKDILIEAVWPDRHPDHSLQNFKVNLYRLRRLLEPELRPSRGSAYIHLKDNLVSLDKHLCQVDTDTLHHLCKRVRRTDTRLDTHDLLAIGREAEALYQGDFLPEEPYLTWAEMKRTTLRQEFIQLMYRLGRRLQDQEEFRAARHCYQRIVRIDPAQEKAQRCLMHLLDKAGRAQDALQTYHTLKAFLASEIGTTPDIATDELFRAIRDRQHSR
jgi:ATP/maltotriose-dependent transcriptional regulator MalT/DNA-binding SARP family transcriptional activator